MKAHTWKDISALQLVVTAEGRTLKFFQLVFPKYLHCAVGIIPLMLSGQDMGHKTNFKTLTGTSHWLFWIRLYSGLETALRIQKLILHVLKIGLGGEYEVGKLVQVWVQRIAFLKAVLLFCCPIKL